MANSLWDLIHASRGVALTLISATIFSFNSLGTQLSTRTVSPWILCFVTSIMYFPYLFLIRWDYGDRYTLSDSFMIFLSALADTLSLCFATLGFSFTSVGNASAIIFSKPIFCTTMAKCFLREKLLISDIVLIVANFIGVMLISKPFSAGFRFDEDKELLGSFAALLSALCSAFQFLSVRKLVERELYDPWLCLFTIGIVACVLFGTLMLLTMKSNHHMKTSTDWLYISLTCLAAASASTLLYLGLKYQSASVVSLVATTEVPSAYLLQIIFTDYKLEPMGIAGAILITIAPVWYAMKGIIGTSSEDIEKD